jgi:hypothetical protein
VCVCVCVCLCVCTRDVESTRLKFWITPLSRRLSLSKKETESGGNGQKKKYVINIT